MVVWENVNADGTTNIMMRYFSASGSPITGITRVSKPGSTDSDPDVAASNGSFVISWTHEVSGTDSDIDAERFVISGGVPVGKGIFGVNTDTNFERARAWRCPRTGASTSPMSGSLRAMTETSLRANITAPGASSAASLSISTAMASSPPASRWTTPAMP